MYRKKNVMLFYLFTSSSLVIISLDDNVRTLATRMTLRKLTHLGYEILTHQSDSSDLSPTDNPFFKHLANCRQKHSFLKGGRICV